MPDNNILIAVALGLVCVVIGLVVLVIPNYRRDDLRSKPTKPYMSDDEWDGK